MLPGESSTTLFRDVGGGEPLTAMGGHFYDLASGVIRKDAITPFVTVSSTFLESVALASNGEVLLAIGSVDVMTRNDAGSRGYGFEAVAVRQGAVVGRARLPEELTCWAQNGGYGCSPTLAVDGQSFVVGKTSAGTTSLVRVNVEADGGVTLSTPLSLAQSNWATHVVVPQGDGSLLVIHDMTDPVLDFTRVASRRVVLSP